MTAQPNSSEATAPLPPNVQDALDYCRSLVLDAADLDGMFRLGAAAVFRTAKKGDPYFVDTVDALYNIANAAGLTNDDDTQKLLNAGIEDAKKAAANGRAAIITPADLQTFFTGWHSAIAEAADRDAKWRECAADVHVKLLTQEIGRSIAERQLSVIAAELGVYAAIDIDAKVAAALDGKPVIMNGHVAAPLPKSPDDYGAAIPAAHLPATIDDVSAIVPAKFITPAAWPNEAPPPVDWLVVNRIPHGDVTTLHGDGGAGKTDIALRLAANVARGAQDWLGHEIATGKVLFVSGEEPERELWRRMWLHSQRDRYNLDSLGDNFQLWLPDNISDAAMAVADRHTGIMRPTRIMQEIAAAISAVAPALVVVDNVAATFAGNQNDRVSVRSYVNLWRQIAHGPSKPAVLLLDHPSLSGLTNGTGRGGNMDWRNAVRSALWLHAPSDAAEADRGIRILETAKSNYGPPGNPVRLQWADGGLQIEHTPSSHYRASADAQCDETFMRLLDERAAQGSHVGRQTSAMYAPKVFADDPSSGSMTKRAFALAMERLFKAGTIHEAWDPKRRHNYIERAAVAVAAE